MIDGITGCLLDHPYIKIYYKMIPIDLSKQQTQHADPKAMQQRGNKTQKCFSL